MRVGSVAGLTLLAFSVFLGMTGCDSDLQSSVREVPDLEPTIAAVKGAYTWRSDLKRYEYSEKLKLEEILSAHSPEQAVAVLIECLDDTSTSASTLNGKPVAIGVVCYEALSQLAYHEPTDSSGDVATAWPGIVSPGATPKQMQDAKAAWKKAAVLQSF
ncbi:MAG: hypothetical protein MZV65_35570 [Chromatiales bacterium]|nr:hypothetical protein [Chromatiales bacterium]